MSQKMSQNIFNYATSELSQDAFISLLVAWFDSEEEELQNIARDFVNSLYREYFQASKILNIKTIELKQQHYKIDVYFEVTEENGNIIPFIIEDKTWTEPHSKQLNRYVNKVVKSTGIKKNKIVKIFFKTGHVTEKDIYYTQNMYYENNIQQNEYCKTIPDYYKIIDIHWIWEFLSKYQIDNFILNQYVAFIHNEFYSEMYDTETNTKKELNDFEYKDVRKGYVQYQIVEYIKSNILQTGIVENKNMIGYVRNGKAWNTWWTFYEESKQYGIFFKIVYLNGKRRIRLVEYSYKNTTAEDKKKSLAINIDICHEILAADNFFGIECGDKRKYQINSGKNKGNIVRESEIANLNLDNALSLEENAKQFSEFIHDFLIKKKSN